MRRGEVSAAVTTATVMRSEGQRMLLCVTGSLAAIALEIGCKSPQTVHSWKTGRKVPSMNARARMQEAFGIPQRAWTQLPTGAPAAVAESADSPALEIVTASAQPSTLEDCLALLTVLRRDRMKQDLVAAERVRLAHAEAHILKLRARLEDAARYAESRYVTEHPAWLRLKRAILHALEPHPDAARAVAEAIATMDPNP